MSKNYLKKDIYGNYSNKYHEPSEDEYMSEEVSMNSSDYREGLEYLEKQRKVVNNLTSYNVNNPSYKIGSSAYNQNFNSAIKNTSKAGKKDIYDIDIGVGKKDKYDINLNSNKNPYDDITLGGKKSSQTNKETAVEKSSSVVKKKNKLDDMFDAELDDQFETKPKKQNKNQKLNEKSENSETSGLSMLKNKKLQNEKNNMVRNSLNLSESNEDKHDNMSMSMSESKNNKFDNNSMNKTYNDNNSDYNHLNEGNNNSLNQESENNKNLDKEDEDNTYGEFDIDKTNAKITDEKNKINQNYDNDYDKTEKNISIEQDNQNKTMNSHENTSIDLNIINTSSKLKISQEIQSNNNNNNNSNINNNLNFTKKESKEKLSNINVEADNIDNVKKPIEFLFDKNINQSVYSGEESITNNIHLFGKNDNINNTTNDKNNFEVNKIQYVKKENDLINLQTEKNVEKCELKDIQTKNEDNKNEKNQISNNQVINNVNEFKESNNNINSKIDNSILEEKLLQKIYQIANKVQLNQNSDNNRNTSINPNNIEIKQEALTNNKAPPNLYNTNNFVSYEFDKNKYYSNSESNFNQNHYEYQNNMLNAVKEIENNNNFNKTFHGNNNITLNHKTKIEYVKINQFDFEKIRKQIVSELEIFGVKQLTKKDLKEIKLEYSLNEERKRKEALELKCEKYQEQIVSLELSIKKYRRTEIENKELCKEKLDLETKYNNLQNELKNTISDYELKCKLIEQRIVSREAKNEQMKINDIERTLKTEIINIKMLLDEKISENEYLKNQVISLEKENSELSFFKSNSLHDKNLVNDLKNEKFILNEKYKEIMSNYEKLLNEKEIIEQKLFIKEFTSSNIGFNNVNEKNMDMNININNTYFKENANLKIDGKKFENFQNEKINFNNLNKFKENNVKDFADALFINDFFEIRDQQTINSIIKSQENEIIRLEGEVEYLKKINRNASKSEVLVKNHFTSNNFNRNSDYNDENMNENIKNDNKNTQSLEEMIIDDFRERLIQLNISLETIEKELFTSNKNLIEIPLETFIVTLSKLNTNLNRYEVEEIYKSMKRNEILTINELKSCLTRDFNFKKEKENLKIKSNNYTQVGPNHSNLNVFSGKQLSEDSTYIKKLEKKVIELETILKELKQHIDINEIKKETLEKEVTAANKKISYLENELENLFNKLEEEKKFNQKLIKDYKLGSEGALDISHTKLNASKGFNEIIEKNKNLENEIIKLSNANKEIQKELISKMENQLANFKSNLEEKNSQEKILLIQENTELKIKMENFENKFQEQFKEFEVKINKYKSNYSQLKVKLEHTEIELEKYKKLNNNPDAFRSEELGIIERKIDLLENNYKDREEKYRQICIMSQSHQINKEIEQITSKFNKEREMYISEINSKNNELLRIKSEFNMIIKEIENLKFNKK